MLGLALWAKFTFFYSESGSDFVQDYYAAKALRSGLSIYGDSIPQLAKATFPDDLFENFHPPFSAILYLPLTLVSFEAAFKLWSVLSLLLYVGMLWSLFAPHLRANVICVALLWYPFIYGTGTGQSSILIAALISFGWLALKQGDQNRAGVLLAIPCAIKLFPLMLGFFLVFSKRWRALRAYLITLLTLLLITFLVVGSQDIISYVQHVTAEDVKRWGAFTLNVSLTGALLPLLTTNPWAIPVASLGMQQALLITNLCSLVAGMGLLLGAARSCSAKRDAEAFSTLLIGMVLCSPISWMHIYPVFFIPFMLVWQKFRYSKLRPLFLLTLILLSLPDVLLSRFLVSVYAGVGIPALVFVLLKSTTWGMVVLLYLVRVEESAINTR